MPYDHHPSCPRILAWDIPDVPCNCPEGWPRKADKEIPKELESLIEDELPPRVPENKKLEEES